MRAESFKDILAEFLEVNQASKEETSTFPKANSHSQTTDIPFVFLDTALSIPRAKMAAYGSARQEKKVKSPSRKSRESLSPTGQRALDCLLRLGALDLETGVSESHVKKAYRRLLKFYHPDHHPLDLSAEDRKLRAEQFLELQRAFKTLQNEVSAVAHSHSQT